MDFHTAKMTTYSVPNSDVTSLLVEQSDWDLLPLDVLACVADHLRPKYLANARMVCKSWCRGLSLGVKHLQPKLQSPLGGRSGSLAGLYVYAMRWHEMPLLLAAFPSCKKLNLHLATITVDCGKYLGGSRALECIQIRSESFCSSSGNSPLVDLTLFAEKVQTVAPHVRIEVDASVYPSSIRGSGDLLSSDAFLRIRTMPSNVLVVSLELRNMSPSAEQMQDVVCLKHLRALYIKDSITAPCGLDDAAFRALAQLPQLQRLSVRAVGSRVTEEGLVRGLQGLTRLQSLELISVAEMSDRAVRILQAGWQDLESLYLTRCFLLTDASLALIRSLPCLFQLFLCGSDNFTSQEIETISRRVSLVNIRN